MNTFSSVMLALTNTLVARALTFLGMGYVTYQSLTVLAEKIQTTVMQNYNQLDDTVLPILDAMGASEYLHIVLTAFISRAGMMAAKRLAMLPTS